MYPILFKAGPLTIYTYGVFVLLGVVSGYFVSLQQAKREGLDKGIFSHILFWTIVFSFIGARIFYVLVDLPLFLGDPLGVILSRAGFVFYGGLVTGVISLYILTKKHRTNFLQYADIISLGIPLGHSLGRLGCFFYGCCYGKPTDLFMGILFPAGSPAGSPGLKVIPTQLISAFFLLVIFFILLFLKKRRRFVGQIFLSHLILYGIFRFIIEFSRGDPRGEILFLSVSQFLAVILIGVSFFWWWKVSPKKGSSL